MQYTIKQLKKLRDIKSLECDDSWMDDHYSSPRGLFEDNTDIFLDWLENIEKQGKINQYI